MGRDNFLLLLLAAVVFLAGWVWSLSGELEELSPRIGNVEDQVWQIMHGKRW